MSGRLQRSIDEPVRDGLTWEERWLGPDRGLIWNWELGRQIRDTEPELAARAAAGELIELSWKGGTQDLPPLEDGEKHGKKYGSFAYLAQWQGIRGEHLDIHLEVETVIVCSATRRAVAFRKLDSTPD
jgi:hypothetical protein